MIEQVPQTGSTNADLVARLRSGERVAEGTWLVADRQTQGRGRQGRQWFDGHGNFMASTAVRCNPSDPPTSTLALVAGLAVYEALLPHCPNPAQIKLKWPNDVLLAGAKLAGILLEREGDYVVVGIGANLAAAPQLSDRQTVALADLGPAPDRDLFAKALADTFDQEVERWRTYGIEPVLRRWESAGLPRGTVLSVHDTFATTVTGQFDGLMPDGAMRLRLADGAARAIHAGEVMLG